MPRTEWKGVSSQQRRRGVCQESKRSLVEGEAKNALS